MRKRIILAGVIAVTVLAVLVVLAIVFFPRYREPEQQVFTPTYWPTNGWQTSTPEDQGLDSVKLVQVLEKIQKKNIQINSLLVVRNGMLVLDAYFYNPYDGKYPHDIASVTKSVMTTLIGIAAGQGKINLDEPMLSYFPNRTIANLDERKEHITVRHLTGMVNGLDSGCMAGDMETLNQMRSNPDWVQASLDREMVREPGKKFCYDSPGMHLLSAILQEATGMTALEYAQQYLFEPLGIRDVIWESDPQGYTRGWGDLHLKPQDAAKIGFLFLNQGSWDGQQIVPADWVKEATRKQADAGADDYGYGWWIYDTSYGASGREGQHIYVVQSINAIVVTTGGGFDYDQIDPLLTAAVIDPAKPLPANPEGVAQLDAALGFLVKALPALPAGEIPQTVQVISGKTYIFEPNPVMLERATLDFNDPAEARIDVRLFGSDATWLVGLDEQYRQSPDGSLQRGYWKDAQTFVIEVFDVGINDRQFTFTDDQLLVEADGMSIEAKMENP
jgi:CubicO group peptidase (beta-lactamase class C family)